MLKVVDSVADPLKEIHVEKAQSVRFGADVNEIVEKPIDPDTFVTEIERHMKPPEGMETP